MLSVEYKNPYTLKLYEKNARTHSKEQVAQIVASIREFGWTNPILLDETDEIIAGHGRLMAALDMGSKKVPTITLEGLSDEQKRAYTIADNQLALNAGWDLEVLSEEVQRLIDDDFDVDLLGFSGDELHEMLFSDEGQTDPDDVPEITADPITQPGDLWIMGGHRLLCGDSTAGVDVNQLMDGTKADLCFTSPPYALGKSIALSGNKSMAAKSNAYGDYDDNADDWDRLMQEWFIESHKAVSDVWVINVQPLAGNKRNLVRFIADNVGRLVDIVTWDKGHAAPAMAAGVMASRFEWMIVFASNEQASRSVPLSSWRGTVQNVYIGPPQRENEFSDVHAATMPTHVPIWVMQTLCDQSKKVFEPFCGTGTTLIAAEMTGRRCFAMEISPEYCDIAVKRWEDYTGKTAERVEAKAA